VSVTRLRNMRCGGGHGVSVSLAVTHLSLRSCSLQPSANYAATYATEFGVAAIAIYKFFSISGRCCKEIGTKKLGINWACYDLRNNYNRRPGRDTLRVCPWVRHAKWTDLLQEKTRMFLVGPSIIRCMFKVERSNNNNNNT